MHDVLRYSSYSPVMNRAHVILMTTVIGPLDYAIPDTMDVQIGSIVEVPLGPRKLYGVVWDNENQVETPIAVSKLRPIITVLDLAPLNKALRELVDWTAHYYLCSRASVLRMVLPPSAAFNPAISVTEYRTTGANPDRMTPKRAQALDAINGQQGLIRELALKADVSDAVIRGLVKTGALEPIEVSIDDSFDLPNPEYHKPQLSDDQARAAAHLTAITKTQKFEAIMLDGVTGSGKTETFFEAVAACIEMGKQCLVLLPEIALTQPFLQRFEERFGSTPASWHSGMKQSERRRTWRAVSNGDASILIGARSALYLPYKNLGLIIVDEAHEASFKQEEGVRYHARDAAVMRAMQEDIPIILSSATPALETRYMAEIGRYTAIELASRFGGAHLPEIETIDLTQDVPERGHWIAPRLIKAIKDTIERGEQSLIFLNRRGYAPLTLCRTCGHRIQCPNCTSWMVEHRLVKRLACHHCGHVMPPPQACAECEEEDSLVACGPGVERINDEIEMMFPEARTFVATSDTLYSPAKAAEFVAKVENDEIDIIIGTQLVTKGYHFPNLTMVGIIDADLGLEGGDLRAAERTFQQISQASGRAGRAAKKGHVYIQTRAPSAPVLQALVKGDRDDFYAAETLSRKHASAPPFGRFAAIIISSEDESEAASIARLIAQTAPQHNGMMVFGPAPAPLAMLRGRYRQRLLLQARRQIALQDIVRAWLEPLEWPKSVRVAVDVDPYSFL